MAADLVATPTTLAPMHPEVDTFANAGSLTVGAGYRNNPDVAW